MHFPSVTFFSLFTLKADRKLWGFQQMGRAPKVLSQLTGLKFGLMLGTGKGRGFSIVPDFARYALLTSWKDTDSAEQFLKDSSFYQGLIGNSQEVFTVRLQTIMAKGEWKGKNPFSSVAANPESYKGPVVAITRAKIRTTKLIEFWKNVPKVSGETGRAQGLLAQTGMGEIPIIEQATFSLWENDDYLKKFAYRMENHRDVIQKTRERNWYKEELFARFIPLAAKGSWNGVNPLKGKCPEDLFGNL